MPIPHQGFTSRDSHAMEKVIVQRISSIAGVAFLLELQPVDRSLGKSWVSSVPCAPWRTHAGAVNFGRIAPMEMSLARAELQSVGRTHVEKAVNECILWEGPHSGAG